MVLPEEKKKFEKIEVFSPVNFGTVEFDEHFRVLEEAFPYPPTYPMIDK